MSQPAAANPVLIAKTVIGDVTRNRGVFWTQLAAKRIGIAAKCHLSILLENAVPVHHTVPGVRRKIFIDSVGGNPFHFCHIAVPAIHFPGDLYLSSMGSPHAKYPASYLITSFRMGTEVCIGVKAGTIQIVRKQLFVTHFLCFLPENTSGSPEVLDSYLKFYS